MPRSGINGTYTLPGPQKTQVPNTPILSSVNNQGYADIEQTFNTVTPKAYGGTDSNDLSLNAADLRIKDGADTTKRVGFDVSGLSTATTRTIAIPNKNGTLAVLSDLGFGQNLGLSVTVAASALTIAVKGADGNDPSATNTVNIGFRNSVLATGTPSNLSITAPVSLTVSSGSTLGTANTVPARLWVVGFNDSGTFRLGVVNVLPNSSLVEGLASATAEGGAGAADNAGVIYAGAAVSSKPMAVLGFIDITQAVAGTWATAPAVVQIGTAFGIKPVPGQGLVLLASGTISNAATLPILLTQYTGFKGIRVNLSNIIPVSDNNQLSLRLSTNGGTSYDATGYQWVQTEINSAAGTSTVASSNSDTIIAVNRSVLLSNNVARGLSASIEIMDQSNVSVFPKLTLSGYFVDNGGGSRYFSGGGARTTAQDTDAIQFFMQSGNIASGSYSVYGYL